MDDKLKKYGARVYQVSDSMFVIKQTVMRVLNSKKNKYVVDEQKECRVNIDDDAAIAEGIRNAIKGNLTAPEQ